MTQKLFASRRNFLKSTFAAAGAVAFGGTLIDVTQAAAAPATDRSGSLAQAAVQQNKMSAVLPPISSNIVLHTPHVIREVAPDTVAELWSYEGSAPGPILHVKEGVPVNFTLDNNSGVMGHSIDFHAANLPWDKYYQMVQPGEKASFTFTPHYPGVFMYHCGTPPVLMLWGTGCLAPSWSNRKMAGRKKLITNMRLSNMNIIWVNPMPKAYGAEISPK